MSRPRASQPDTIPDDLVRDPGHRDLLADGKLRDLHKDRSAQDLAQDRGVQEAIRLGVLPAEQFPSAVRMSLPPGRSGGFATGTWRRSTPGRTVPLQKLRSRSSSRRRVGRASLPAPQQRPRPLPRRAPIVRLSTPTLAPSDSPSARSPGPGPRDPHLVKGLGSSRDVARVRPARRPPVLRAAPTRSVRPPATPGRARPDRRPPVPLSAASRPQKLGSGEILVLRIGPDEIVSAVNRRGRLVIQRHPLPS